jgi:hypothetical protein
MDVDESVENGPAIVAATYCLPVGHHLSNNSETSSCTEQDELQASSDGHGTGFLKKKRPFAEVLRHWMSTELSISQESLTRLLSLLHDEKTTLFEEDYKKLPKTGKGLLWVPNLKRHNILFRNLAEYDRDTDKFIRDDDFDEDVNSDIEDVDDEVPNDDEGYEPDELGDEESSLEQNRPGPISLGSYAYASDIERHMKMKEKMMKRKSNHRMCYLGLENVLTGRSCGMLSFLYRHIYRLHNFYLKFV